MKLKTSLLLCALAFANLNAAYAQASNAKVLSASSSDNSCKFDVSFNTDPQVKEQTMNVSQGVELKLKQYIAVRTHRGANIASNVICQHLVGQQYTGSQEEWKGFINTAVQGMMQHGFKDLKFTKVGTDDAAYKGQYPNFEYTFTGDIGGNKQIIHNLAVLDKKNNQVITFSVSGNEKVESEIKSDYQQLINSFSL
ncbi:hypothetical protein [Pseudoalteromonas sp. 2CM28B]|uniref:hypothetical protein n=1 Tax=Pseudoalteromonas sp. 2CM28B TaxID=2929851 RepID=UPI0020BDF4C1|nr:hypothetical protein [Pseudoalteromonas sp. 2CM28B]MCK8132668.1 hypothetical protein [Pseudoalteromonas sp. 2CM28B]